MISQSETDVVIIGAGPAGLMAAWWMARCGISARIIDKRGKKVINGHADGLRPRTEELFDSMGGGVQEKIQAEGYIFENMMNWVKDDNGRLARSHSQRLSKSYVADLPSPFLPHTITQGRIERFLLDAIEGLSDSALQIERGTEVTSFDYEPSLESAANSHPLKLTLRTLSGDEADPLPAPGVFGGRNIVAEGNMPRDELSRVIRRQGTPGSIEIVKAKYLIGCDGAHSWLRTQLGFKVLGASTDSVWGTMDIVPMTNFPDIYRPAFLSGELGTLMIVPRERNLTRLYVPFNDQDHEEPFDRSSITLERILARAKKFFEPYTLDFKVCEYWSVYQVGQRVSENNQHPSNRIFLAGDAVHMHSPKVGLGMNTSMQDGYNLGWKVAMAAVGAAKDTAAMLETYRDERYPVAQKLVEFDRTLFGDHGSLDPADFLERHAQFREFSDGRKLDYPESILVHKQTSKQSAATGLIVGESFKHQKVLGHANSQLYWTTKLLHSDGTFRIVLFAGNIGQRAQMNRVKKFCDQLESNRKGSAGDHTSLLHTRFPYRFGHSKKDSKDDARTSQHPAISFHHEKRRTSMISLLAIHSTPQCTESITLFDFPPALYGPFDPEYHGYDFARIFVDEPVHYDRYCDGRAYERWGVDREQGAVVIVRPDMHVGWVGRLEDVDDIEMYFAAVLK